MPVSRNLRGSSTRNLQGEWLGRGHWRLRTSHGSALGKIRKFFAEHVCCVFWGMFLKITAYSNGRYYII